MIKLEAITKIDNVTFYKGNIIYNGMKKQQLIMSNNEMDNIGENFRVDIDEDIIKACKRIYHNYYE